MRDKKGGFPSFLRNKFVGNSREQLLIGLEHANVLTQQEVREAVYLSQLIPEIMPKLWRVACDMEVKLCGANRVCVCVWVGGAVELEILLLGYSRLTVVSAHTTHWWISRMSSAVVGSVRGGLGFRISTGGSQAMQS